MSFERAARQAAQRRRNLGPVWAIPRPVAAATPRPPRQQVGPERPLYGPPEAPPEPLPIPFATPTPDRMRDFSAPMGIVDAMQSTFRGQTPPGFAPPPSSLPPLLPEEQRYVNLLAQKEQDTGLGSLLDFTRPTPMATPRRPLLEPSVPVAPPDPTGPILQNFLKAFEPETPDVMFTQAEAFRGTPPEEIIERARKAQAISNTKEYFRKVSNMTPEEADALGPLAAEFIKEGVEAEEFGRDIRGLKENPDYAYSVPLEKQRKYNRILQRLQPPTDPSVVAMRAPRPFFPERYEPNKAAKDEAVQQERDYRGSQPYILAGRDYRYGAERNTLPWKFLGQRQLPPEVAEKVREEASKSPGLGFKDIPGILAGAVNVPFELEQELVAKPTLPVWKFVANELIRVPGGPKLPKSVRDGIATTLNQIALPSTLVPIGKVTKGSRLARLVQRIAIGGTIAEEQMKAYTRAFEDREPTIEELAFATVLGAAGGALLSGKLDEASSIIAKYKEEAALVDRGLEEVPDNSSIIGALRQSIGAADEASAEARKPRFATPFAARNAAPERPPVPETEANLLARDRKAERLEELNNILRNNDEFHGVRDDAEIVALEGERRQLAQELGEEVRTKRPASPHPAANAIKRPQPRHPQAKHVEDIPEPDRVKAQLDTLNSILGDKELLETMKPEEVLGLQHLRDTLREQTVRGPSDSLDNIRRLAAGGEPTGTQELAAEAVASRPSDRLPKLDLTDTEMPTPGGRPPRHVLRTPAGDMLEYRENHIVDVNVVEQRKGTGTAMLNEAIGRIRKENPEALITADLNTEGGVRLVNRQPGVRFLDRTTGKPITLDEAVELANAGKGPQAEIPPMGEAASMGVPKARPQPQPRKRPPSKKIITTADDALDDAEQAVQNAQQAKRTAKLTASDELAIPANYSARQLNDTAFHAYSTLRLHESMSESVTGAWAAGSLSDERRLFYVKDQVLYRKGTNEELGHFLDVASEPWKYDLTPDEKQFMVDIQDIIRSKVDEGIDAGVLPEAFKVGDEVGDMMKPNYVPRTVVSIDGEGVRVRPHGKAGIGSRQTFEVKRTREEAGQDKRVVYLDSITDNVQVFLRSVDRKINAKKATDIMDSELPGIGQTAAQRANPALRKASEDAQKELKDLKNELAKVQKQFDRIPPVRSLRGTKAAREKAAARNAVRKAELRATIAGLKEQVAAATAKKDAAVKAFSDEMDRAGRAGAGEAVLPEPFAQGKIYPQRYVDAINRQHEVDPRLVIGDNVISIPGFSKHDGKPGVFVRLSEAISGINNALRPIWATGDLSATGLQTLPIALNDPVGWSRMMGMSTSSLASPDGYYQFMKRAYERGTVHRLVKAGGRLYGTNVTFDHLLDEPGIRGTGKVSRYLGMKASNDVWNRMLDIVSITQFENYTDALDANPSMAKQIQGLITKAFGDIAPVTKAGLSAEESIAAAIMHGTGRLSLQEMSKKGPGQRLALQTLPFAGNYWSAWAKLIGDTIPLLGGKTANAAISRRMIAGWLGMGVGLYSLAAELSGQKAVLDPRDPNFLTLEAGGYRIGFGGPLKQIMRTIGKIADNPEEAHETFARFARGHASPFFSTFSDLVIDKFMVGTSRTYLGKPLDSVEDFVGYAASRFVPFSAQEPVAELASGNPSAALETLKDSPVTLLGGTSYPVSPMEELKEARERALKDLFNSMPGGRFRTTKDGKLLSEMSYDELKKHNPELARRIDEDEDVQEALEELDNLDVIETKENRFYDQVEKIRAKYYDMQLELDKLLETGAEPQVDAMTAMRKAFRNENPFEPNKMDVARWKELQGQYKRDQYKEIQSWAESLGIEYGEDVAPEGSVSAALDNWFNVNAEDAEFQNELKEVDWDAFFAARDATLDGLSAADRKDALNYIKRYLTPKQKEYFDDVKKLSDEGWWVIPEMSWDMLRGAAPFLPPTKQEYERNLRKEIEKRYGPEAVGNLVGTDKVLQYFSEAQSFNREQWYGTAPPEVARLVIKWGFDESLSDSQISAYDKNRGIVRENGVPVEMPNLSDLNPTPPPTATPPGLPQVGYDPNRYTPNMRVGDPNTASYVERRIREVFPQYGLNPDFWIEVARRESGLGTNPINPNDTDGYPSLGIFQLHVGGLHDDFINMGYTDALDPDQNIEYVAQWLATNRYVSPWPNTALTMVIREGLNPWQ